VEEFMRPKISGIAFYAVLAVAFFGLIAAVVVPRGLKRMSAKPTAISGAT
jgi:hypothetical protein